MITPESSTSGAPAGPTRRNALVTWLIPMVCFALAPPLGNFLGTTPFRFAPTAAILTGVLITITFAQAMVAELNVVAGSSLKTWHLLIPIYGIYWAAVLVRKEMTVAKQKASKGSPRSLAVYLFLPLYALAADLNDLAPQAGNQRP